MSNTNTQFKKGHKTWNKGLKGTHFSPETEFKKGEHSSIKTEFKKGSTVGHRFSKGHIPFYKGEHCLALAGDKNYLWKGDKANYFAKHNWVKRWKGNPSECEICGLKGEKVGRRWNLEWANVDHKYLRDLNDFISLCISCHKKYDYMVRNIPVNN